MKKCPKCGTILDDSKKKCYMCGTLLNKGSNDFSDTFDTQTGSVNSSFNSVFENSDFLFNNGSNNNHDFDVPENAFFDAGMDKLNSMQYDERSGLKKGFDSVFKNGDSFKSKDDELKSAEEAEIRRKEQEDAMRLKQEEKERLAKEKQLKKEREKERLAHEKAERERAKAERESVLKAEREQRAHEKAERDAVLKKEREEKERLIKEQKAKEKAEKEESLRIERERIAKEKAEQAEALRVEKERLVLEQKEKEAETLRLKAEAAKQDELRKIEEEKMKIEKEQRLSEEKAQKERMIQQEKQAAQMKAQRDEAYNNKFLADKKNEESNKPSINWGDGLVDTSVDEYNDKINKVNKKKSLTGFFNFLSFLIFLGLVAFGYFKFVKPSLDTNKEIGDLSYVINKDFKLSNKAEDNKFYSYGESCGLRLSYGSTNDANGFVDNYFNDIKTQYSSDMNSFTERSELKINGNVWSELSVIYLEDAADLSKKENIVKYRYVSIVYDGKYYHTVFVNPNNDKKCYDMYEEFIQSMEFDEKR